MFDFQYSDSSLKNKVENPQKQYPDEVCQELPQFIQRLRKDGQMSGTDYFMGGINRISAKTFVLDYLSDFDNGVVKLINLEVKSADLLRSRFSLQNDWDDSDVLDTIPQCDRPQKMIKALKLILGGVSDSYDLGYELGHRGKKREYISRHGQYVRQALDELKLITSYRDGRKLIPELATRGKLIAESDSEQMQNKLLTVAMLNYPPVWKIIDATTKGDDEFTQKTVEELIFPVELRDSDTCARRSQAMRSWITWISSTSGIPIRLPGGYKQLTLPMFSGLPDMREDL
jgi:hypothetical protein